MKWPTCLSCAWRSGIGLAVCAGVGRSTCTNIDAVGSHANRCYTQDITNGCNVCERIEHVHAYDHDSFMMKLGPLVNLQWTNPEPEPET